MGGASLSCGSPSHIHQYIRLQSLALRLLLLLLLGFSDYSAEDYPCRFMLCTVLLNDRFSSSLGYIPSWTTILSSFIESITTNTARIVPIGNHISVFIPASQIKQKAKFMEISPGMDLSPSMIARQLRDMADRFEYQYIEEEKCSICASLPFLSQSQVKVPAINGIYYILTVATTTTTINNNNNNNNDN
ncbi:hypothetical protein DINM_003029 [Dirofilaria immitis]|nr:hypothetical protein [Dirofilaria immitis]